jgi:hypothetical protein
VRLHLRLCNPNQCSSRVSIQRCDAEKRRSEHGLQKLQLRNSAFPPLKTDFDLVPTSLPLPPGSNGHGSGGGSSGARSPVASPPTTPTGRGSSAGHAQAVGSSGSTSPGSTPGGSMLVLPSSEGGTSGKSGLIAGLMLAREAKAKRRSQQLEPTGSTGAGYISPSTSMHTLAAPTSATASNPASVLALEQHVSPRDAAMEEPSRMAVRSATYPALVYLLQHPTYYQGEGKFSLAGPQHYNYGLRLGSDNDLPLVAS